MKLIGICLVGVLCGSVLVAEDAFIGKWRFNSQKSRVANPSNYRNYTQTVEGIGPEQYRISETRTAPADKETTFIWVLVLDGKEHTLDDGTSNYERLDQRRFNGTLKRNGHSEKVECEISADGRTMSLHIKGSGLTTGRPIDDVQIFDKQ